MLCDWILQFKEESTSNIISECLDIIQERYNDSPQEIEYLLRSLSEDNTPVIAVELFPQFVQELMNLLEVRIASLSAKNPKSEESNLNKNEEDDFFTTIGEIAKESNMQYIDMNTSLKILVNYFKGIQAKYCMVPLQNENENENENLNENENENQPEEEPDENTYKDNLPKGAQKHVKEFDKYDQRASSELKNDFRVENVDYEDEDDQIAKFNNPEYSESDQYYENRNNDVRQSVDSKIDQRKSQTKSKSKSKSPLRGDKDGPEIEKRLDLEPTDSLEDRRNSGLKEIFDFYSRQHLMIGKRATFEQIEYELSNLNMGEFMKFCKDFYIPVSKVKCAEVFKKTAKNSKEMFLDNFKAAIPKLFSMRNKEELENLEKRLKEVKKLIIKRKKKLEIDESPVDEIKPTSKKLSIRQSSLSPKEPKETKEESPPKIKEEDISKDSPMIQQNKPKIPLKSKGGDPHGAIQRMENEALEKLRKEKLDAQQELNIKNREIIRSPERDRDSDEKLNTTDNEQPEEVKQEIRKVDEQTLKARIAQDKEMRTLQEEKVRISNLIDERKKQNQDEDEEKLKEEALQYIQCEDPNKYKKKIIGFSSPFGVIDKNERIDKEDKSKKYKFKSKEDKELIKAKVREIKTQRDNQKKKKDQEKEDQYQKHRNLMKNLHFKLMKDKDGGFKEGTIPAYQLKSEDQIYDVRNSHPALKLNQLSASKNPGPQQNAKQSIKPPPNKYTLESLGLLKYEDFIGGGSDGFNPADIVDENDHDSEDEILRRYRVNDKNIIENQKLNIQRQKLVDEQPYQTNSNQLKQLAITDRVKDDFIKKKNNRGHNNSISNVEGLSIPKTLSKKDLIAQQNSKSKQNLLNKQEIKTTIKKRGPTTDDEKVYKNKLVDNRSRKVDLPKGAAKSGRKYDNAYASDSPPKNRSNQHITRSVKKTTSKISQSMAIDKNGKINMANIKSKEAKGLNPRAPGNISMDMYDRANKLESKTKRNQEERLQNILKMHDNNVKRGVGIANKGRLL